MCICVCTRVHLYLYLLYITFTKNNKVLTKYLCTCVTKPIKDLILVWPRAVVNFYCHILLTKYLFVLVCTAYKRLNVGSNESDFELLAYLCHINVVQYKFCSLEAIQF